LSYCAISSICNIINITSVSVSIEDNEEGCNSVEEVAEACGILDVEEQSIVSSQKSAVRVYPNPSSGIVNFQFDRVDVQRVTLKIYDLRGQELITVVDRVTLKGRYIVGFDTKLLLPGIYFYRLTASNHSYTGKLVVVK
jgi:hypothetical protein